MVRRRPRAADDAGGGWVSYRACASWECAMLMLLCTEEYTEMTRAEEAKRAESARGSRRNRKSALSDSALYYNSALLVSSIALRGEHDGRGGGGEEGKMVKKATRVASRSVGGTRALGTCRSCRYWILFSKRKVSCYREDAVFERPQVTVLLTWFWRNRVSRQSPLATIAAPSARRLSDFQILKSMLRLSTWLGRMSACDLERRIAPVLEGESDSVKVLCPRHVIGLQKGTT